MAAFLRMVCWITAIIFAASPVLFSVVATGPSSITHLFLVRSYADHGRDLVFVSIAILAIGLIDALETIILIRDRPKTAQFAIAFLLTVVIILQLVAWALWSAQTAEKVSLQDVGSLLNVMIAAGVCAMFSRLTLLTVAGG